ncbi:MAG: FAD-binding oxidoreductase [Candidatus Taylorbacteria bacterium]|nr:FAD-binding oxidoreductase [Candidatus Taylorbacteria bacterium]
MKKNRSPWIHQLNHDREHVALKEDASSDVVVVGAGIAGISTAFFILRNTDKAVIVAEKGKLAHGATGHNAGQIASYFERPFSELCEEFGIELAGAAQRDVESAWQLIDLMFTEAGLTIPLARFMGQAGFTTYDQIVRHLKDNVYRKKAGLRIEEFRIADSAPFAGSIPKEYEGFYTLVPQSEVLDLLQTDNRAYVASLSFQKGCLNSALFCQEIFQYLRKAYPDRFSLYEHTPISKIALHKGGAILDAGKATISAKKVVLCTNGFEGFTIINEGGLAVDAKFHHYVRGMVGYMSAYLEPMNKPPAAISYFPPGNFNAGDPFAEDPYFYLTRRPFDFMGNDHMNLISVGGPELSLSDRDAYDGDLEYPDAEKDKINAFVRSTYDTAPNKEIDYQFTWHGLMGYTPSGVRVVGEEPKNRSLVYNLGCNGVGILPSIYGAKRISDILAGKKPDRSIFDPRE